MQPAKSNNRSNKNNRRRHNKSAPKQIKKVRPTKLKKKEELESSLLDTLSKVHGQDADS